MGERRSSRVGPDRLSLYLPPPPPQTAPGLQVLSSTSRLFTVEQTTNPLHLHAPGTFHRTLKVYNGDGEHILSVGEAQQGCLPVWQVLIYVCSVAGDVVAKVVQRSSGCCGRSYAHPKASFYYRADRIISRYYERRSSAEEEEENVEPNSWIHAVDKENEFLGHYWDAPRSVMILDANLTPSIRLQQPSAQQLQVSQGELTVEVMNEWRSSLDGTGGHIKYLIMEGRRRAGTVFTQDERASKTSNNLPFPFTLGAHFPHEFTQVDKLLILGFLLYKSRKSSGSNDELYLQIFCGFLAILLVVSTVAVLLGVLYRIAHVSRS